MSDQQNQEDIKRLLQKMLNMRESRISLPPMNQTQRDAVLRAVREERADKPKAPVRDWVTTLQDWLSALRPTLAYAAAAAVVIVAVLIFMPRGGGPKRPVEMAALSYSLEPGKGYKPARSSATESIADVSLSSFGRANPVIHYSKLSAATAPLPSANVRGAEELIKIYTSCAPAVVVILTPTSLGSGFFISKDGWLVTNHHVAIDATAPDSDDLQVTNLEVTVHLGRLNTNGAMEPYGQPLKAVVYKWDRVRDLALLKIVAEGSDSNNISNYPYLKLSQTPVVTGQDAVAIGNAAVTLLWSIKPGTVQSVNSFANGLYDILAHWDEKRVEPQNKSLSLDQFKKEWEADRNLEDKRKLIMATCPITHGDSGGPLLDMKGNVIGITDLGSDKANYFVHVDEIKDFLKETPAFPISSILDPYDLSQDTVYMSTNADGDTESHVVTYDIALNDADGDSKEDTMIFKRGVNNSTNCVALGWDLKGRFNNKTYQKSSGDLNLYNIWENRGMPFDVFLETVFDDHGQPRFNIAGYDLNGDGIYEQYRIQKIGGPDITEFLLDAKTGNYKRVAAGPDDTLILTPMEVPEPLRAKYQDIVMYYFKK